MATATGGHTSLDVFRLLAKARREGRGSALVTVVGLTGSSARSVGTHMAVVEDGRFAGSFSGGCVEAAVVAEAQRSISSGKSQVVRFGAGSPYIDIRLPCGGGADLLFQPRLPREIVETIADRLTRRQPVTLQLRAADVPVVIRPRTEADAGAYQVRHVPPLRLLILGHGEESLALARLALSFGAEVELWSSEAGVVGHAAALGAVAKQLPAPDGSGLVIDQWTAIVLLFHDHDLEPPLLVQALQSSAFFIGAMGSRGTHAQRLEQLRQAGLPAKLLSRVRGPIGLIPNARDPSMLALSTLAQVADEYRRLVA